MVSNITAGYHNPTLYYKLDPGEPGLANPKKASNSIMEVAAHELGNLRRFEKTAVQNGGIVINEKISLNIEKKGNFMAATSGKSQALILYKEDNNNINFEKNNNADKQSDSAGSANVSNAGDSSKIQVENKINIAVNRLNQKLNNLNQKLKTADPGKINKIKSQVQNIEYKLNQIKQIENKLKTKEQLSDINNLISNASSANDIVSNLIQPNNNSGGESTDTISDFFNPAALNGLSKLKMNISRNNISSSNNNGDAGKVSNAETNSSANSASANYETKAAMAQINAILSSASTGTIIDVQV